MKKIIYHLFFFITVNIVAQESLNNQQKENLKAFSRVYGYVKYFHPSDEAYELDWGKFAIYGANQVVNVKTNDELVLALENVFKPIAPSVVFYKTKNKLKINQRKVMPDKLKDYETTFWQHRGLGFGTEGRGNVYRSVRVNAYEIKKEKSTFGASSIKLNGRLYAGKKIKISAKAKYKGSKGSGRLWMRVDRKEGLKGFFSNMNDNPVENNEWGDFEIIGNVALDAESIFLGFMLLGEGEMKIDNFKLFIEQNNKWDEITIENGDFENVKSKKWSIKGKGYETDYVLEDMKENHILKVSFNPDAKKRKTKKIFDTQLYSNDYLNKPINDKISCYVPLTLYRNKKGTYPMSNADDLRKLYEEVSKVDVKKRNLAFQYGNIINAWNVFQHFYPYFDVVDVNWDNELMAAFSRCKKDFNSDDFIKNLEQLTATLKDGHVWVYGQTKNNYYPEFLWEWIEGKLIVTKVSGGLGLSVGDEIIKINGKTSKEYFNEIEKTISAPTKGWLHHRFKTKSMQGEKFSVLNLTKSTKENINVIRKIDRRTFYNQFVKEEKPKIKEIEKDVFYLNLDKVTMDEIKSNLFDLKKAKSIICDLRGYPNSNHKLISYLLSENDDNESWMQIPLIVYPDQERVIKYEKFGWNMKASKPKLKAKIFFLIDGSAISYAESFMGFIEGYKLATIIGQPTAGTNGNINPFTLPGHYKISWTGMKVLKHNGTQHHGIGVLPNVYVNKTIKGVKEGRDEFLEKAIELARK